MSKQIFAGKTVEEATDLALDTLGVKLEDVEISVVNPGRSGILGFGGEAAEIEVRLVTDQGAKVAVEDTSADEDEQQPQPEQLRDRPPRSRGGRRRGRRRDQRGQGRQRGQDEQRGQVRQRDQVARRGQRGNQQQQQPVSEAADEEAQPVMQSEGDRQPARSQASRNDQPPAEYDEEAEQAVGALLDYFFATLGVHAETYVREEREGGSLVFEIEGSDAGLLIGRRGETLHALQFLVRMIVGRQLGRKAYIILDVEDYRERRADMLQNLARRTAGRVASSGGASSLEPMSPAERRVVHMALADHPGVRTESEGKGDRRRVVILPRD